MSFLLLFASPMGTLRHALRAYSLRRGAHTGARAVRRPPHLIIAGPSRPRLSGFDLLGRLARFAEAVRVDWRPDFTIAEDHYALPSGPPDS
jgi:hypothetical protein